MSAQIDLHDNETINQNIAQFPNMRDLMWRALPILMLIASFAPSIIANISNISQFTYFENNFSAPFINKVIISIFGNVGTIIMAIIPAGLICFGIWKCGKVLGAKIWASSLACTIYIAASAFGLTPNFHDNLDDGFFAAFILFSACFLIKAVDKKSQIDMALAFFWSVMAVLLRPFAAWPQFAVFVAIILTTKHFQERPIYGLISALCWGPGLYVAYGAAQLYENNFAMDFSKPLVSNFIKPDTIKELFNFANIKSHIFEIGYFLLSTLPFVVLGILSLIAFISLYNQKQKTTDGKIRAFSIFLIFAIIGAMGYGQINAARLLLDGLFIAIISAISGANVDFGLKNWISKLKTKKT
ncbi:MAG: glycosyltransferase family 39 protein [Caulobacterales bacterium]|nr:glycosyltransferase family 39 protein [Caulobacterales bacterium]MCA0372085.1 hypothetical protein [Pseudomonadota bacterium]